MTQEPKQDDSCARENEQIDTSVFSRIRRGWDKVEAFFRNNPTLGITLLYLYANAIGIIYSATLYARFGINIFDYSEISDFVLAAFKNLDIFISVGLQVAIMVLFLTILKSTEGKADPLPALMVIGLTTAVITIVSLSMVSPYLDATNRASGIKEGKLPAVDVRYRAFTGSAGQVTEPGLELIGTTQRVVLFYDVDKKHTLVIPQSQIVSIEVPEYSWPECPSVYFLEHVLCTVRSKVGPWVR